MDNYGLLSLIPVLVLFIVAFSTKKSLEPLLISALVGHLILFKGTFIGGFIGSLYKVMGSSSMIWLILVVTLFGSLIALLEKSGGLAGFSGLARKYANTRKRSMIITWILGCLFFLDDYLHNLTTGPTMKHVSAIYPPC